MSVPSLRSTRPSAGIAWADHETSALPCPAQHRGRDLVTHAFELQRRNRAELMELLRGGHPVDAAALADTRYRGISLGLPAWLESLTWKKFGKCFANAGDGRIRGWNVRTVQDGLDAPWTAMQRSDGSPKTFGFFEVVPAAKHRVHRSLEHSLLIHYGLGGNRALDPIGWLRDPLVALNPNDPSVLLGWTYLDLGLGLRLGTPSFFSLELDGALTHSAVAPAMRNAS